MGRYSTRDLLRQFFADELADERLEEVPPHVDRGCMNCLFSMRELMAHTEPDLLAELLSLGNSAVSAEQRATRFTRAVRQTFFRALTVEGERRLGPTLLAEIERRPAEANREAESGRQGHVLGEGRLTRPPLGGTDLDAPGQTERRHPVGVEAVEPPDQELAALETSLDARYAGEEAAEEPASTAVRCSLHSGGAVGATFWVAQTPIRHCDTSEKG